jgi:AraC-like DNA-binding protein
MTYTYISRILSPPLDAYIDCLYYLDGSLPQSSTNILPMPWLDLKINLGGALHTSELGRDQPSAKLTGTWCVGICNGCHIVHWPHDLKLFGVCFKPEGAYPFFQFPLSELHNQVISLDEVWGRFATNIREQMHRAPTIEAGFDQLEQALLVRLGECELPHGFEAVRYGAVEIARHRGALSIRALSEHIGISQKHLLTQFKRLVGISPKEMACLSRLQHTLHAIDASDSTHPVDWALMARKCGYYDQAHLSNDFMAHLGHNPTHYLKLRRQAQLESQKSEHLFRSLPVG